MGLPGDRNPLRPRALLLALPAVLALVQALLLVQRPGRLLEVTSSSDSGSGASLQLRFSRPLQPGSLARETSLGDGTPIQVRGEGTGWFLRSGDSSGRTFPVQVRFGGRNLRRRPLPDTRLLWDPRPLLVVVASSGERERLEVLEPGGSWRPLTPWQSQIGTFLPLGDGSGVAYSTSADGTAHRNRLVPVTAPATWPAPDPPPTPEAGPPRTLPTGETLQSHFSSSLQGDLLIQTDSLIEAGSVPSSRPSLTLIRSRGSILRLENPDGEPTELLPGGDGLLVTERDGLAIRTLPPLAPSRSFLPGRRDLRSFCSGGQNALLSQRHADYSRSLELLSPGQAPRRLWSGKEAILAATCDATGSRIWALTSDDRQVQGQGGGTLALLELRPEEGHRSSTPLPGWRPSADASTLSFDPVQGRLLTVLSPAGEDTAWPVLIDVGQRNRPPRIEVVPKRVRQAAWLVRH